jgi:hypothetical protein
MRKNAHFVRSGRARGRQKKVLEGAKRPFDALRLLPFGRLRAGRMRMVPATAGSPQVLVGCSAGWGASVTAQGSTE